MLRHLTSLILMAMLLWPTLGAATSNAKKSAVTPATLDYLVVEVNGDPRIVHLNQHLYIVKGDKFKITEAILTDRSQRAGLVNLIGFSKVEETGLADDRNIEINSASALSKRWSLMGAGASYRVEVSTSGKLHGEALITLTEPRLSHAVISLNGETKVWREGEVVSAKSSDKVKVEKVVTNLGEDDKTVDFQIVPVPAPSAEKLVNRKFFEIRFLRGKNVFARIPMQVEGL